MGHVKCHWGIVNLAINLGWHDRFQVVLPLHSYINLELYAKIGM